MKTGIGGPCGQQADHEPTVWLCGQAGLQHPGLRLEEDCQQVKRGDPSALVSPGEATSGVLCSVVGSLVRERHGHTGSEVKGDKDNEGTRTSSIGEAERAQLVWPGEEKAHKDLINVYIFTSDASGTSVIIYFEKG